MSFLYEHRLPSGKPLTEYNCPKDFFTVAHQVWKERVLLVIDNSFEEILANKERFHTTKALFGFDDGRDPLLFQLSNMKTKGTDTYLLILLTNP